jgi:predicted MPP superfamily phosphohydrolase
MTSMTHKPHVTRRQFLKMTGVLGMTAGAAVAGGVYGFNVEPNQLQIERVTIPLARLPGAFDGMSLVQLSDLHLGPYVTEEHLARAVEITNALKPDAIVVTGDLVNSSWRYIQPCAELLGGLGAPLGVFAVMGNHDYWVGYLDLMLQSLRKNGVTLLRNQAFPLTRGRATLYLVGIDDLWLRLADLRRALARVPANACKIALMHEPDFADVAAQAEIDLQLSGHSHGGQVRVPFWGPLVLPKYAEKYPMGLARAGNFTQVYTTRGVGVLPPPIRLNCPPEITHITLTIA